MKPILYPANETEFRTKGLGTISDALYCEVTEARNGVYDLEMQVTERSKHYSDIRLERILLAKPNPDDDPQPFRIHKISRPINGVVTILANHISYDLKGIPVNSFIARSCSEAVALLKSSALVFCPFTITTDIVSSVIMTVAKPYSVRDLMGGVEGSLIDTYGGEYKFDKYSIQLLSARGQDRGVKIKYGVNLIDMTQEENCSSVYTGVLPYYASEKGIVVGHIQRASGTFEVERILPLDVTSYFQNDYDREDTLPTAAQLDSIGADYVRDNNVGVPKVSIELTFAQLKRKVVRLCDTVSVVFERMGIETTAKVIETTYDVIAERYKSVKLGEPRANIINSMRDESTARAAVDAEMRSYLEKSDSAIRAKVSKVGGDNSSFGWEMINTGHIWYSNEKEVMRANSSGLTITGEIKATSGFIGSGINNGFSISDTALYNRMASLESKSNGVYVGTDGIALGGGRFKVTSDGVLTATGVNISGAITATSGTFSGTISGSTISGGTITGSTISGGTVTGTTVSGSTVSGGTISGSTISGGTISGTTISGGTVTGSTITGGSINIGDGKFAVSSTGYLTANMTGGSLSIGTTTVDGQTVPRFSVDSSGNLTARAGTFTGNITGSAITGGSINIGDGRFVVSSAGYLTADIAGGSINLGEYTDPETGQKKYRFSVDSGGNITAMNGTFGGTVYAKNIVVGTNEGYITGSQIGQGTIAGSNIDGKTIGASNIIDYSFGDLQMTPSGISGASLASGIITSLGYANNYNSATQSGTSTYPAYFTAGRLISMGSLLASEVELRGVENVTLSNHYHSIIVNDNGTVTFGQPYNSNTPPSFNQADTTFYRNGVSAAKRSVTVQSVSVDTNTGITYNPGPKTLTVPVIATTSENTATEPGDLVLTSVNAYDAWAAGKASETIDSITQDTSGSITYDSVSKTLSVPVKATTASGTEATATLTGVNAYDAWDAGNTDGTATARATYEPTTMDFSYVISNDGEYFTVTAEAKNQAGTVVKTGSTNTSRQAYNNGVAAGRQAYEPTLITITPAVSNNGRYYTLSATATNRSGTTVCSVSTPANTNSDVYNNGVEAGWLSGGQTAGIYSIDRGKYYLTVDDDVVVSGGRITIDVPVSARPKYNRYSDGADIPVPANARLETLRYDINDIWTTAAQQGIDAGVASVTVSSLSATDIGTSLAAPYYDSANDRWVSSVYIEATLSSGQNTSSRNASINVTNIYNAGWSAGEQYAYDQTSHYAYAGTCSFDINTRDYRIPVYSCGGTVWLKSSALISEV